MFPLNATSRTQNVIQRKLLKKTSSPFAKGDTQNFYIFWVNIAKNGAFCPKLWSFSTKKGQGVPVLFCEQQFSHVQAYVNRARNHIGVYIVEFKIPLWFDLAIRIFAIPDSEGKKFPLHPQIADPELNDGYAFGLPPNWVVALQVVAIPNSARKLNANGQEIN